MKEIIETKMLNVNGNQIAVCIFPEKHLESIEDKSKLRKTLVKNFKNRVDTVMIVSKIDGSLVRTLVFEPNSGSDEGSFSSMCGNGLRAVRQVTNATIFITPAGTFYSVAINEEEFLCIRECISVEVEEAQDIKDLIESSFGIKVLKVRLSKNIENLNCRGEPHLTILIQNNEPLSEIYNVLENLGFKLSRILKSEDQVNVTVVSLVGNGTANATTFERNLGSNSEVAITGSCGTGAMAAANLIDNYFNNSKGGIYELKFPEDLQRIVIKNKQTYIFTSNNYESI